MYFKITHSAIYNWKGSGTEQERNDPSLMDSFCHLIIAHEATTEDIWLLLIDQGDDTGVSTSNCIEYIIPRICEEFTLEISNLRAFEVWPHHKYDPKLKYTEIVISDVKFDNDGDWVLRIVSGYLKREHHFSKRFGLQATGLSQSSNLQQ